MNIYEKLLEIQQELKAPKGQKNTFGNYKYRNCEDILEAVKPLLLKTKTIAILTDEIVERGNRNYVQANARLIDTESLEDVSVFGYAREEENKKGMDQSQITGSSSSYARKYALNGLFAIDDTKDSDTTNKGEEKKKALVTKDDISRVKEQSQSLLKCKECGEQITAEVARYSNSKYGKMLCRTHQK